MLTQFVFWAAIAMVGFAIIAVPLRLAANAPPTARALAGMTRGLLLIAGILGSVMTLMILAAAAWGMDTNLPWGLGVYLYLIPALSLPAFFLLFISVKATARTLWLLTIANALAWYFGDRADRIFQGLQPKADFGISFNFFTILLALISVLVELAAFCRGKEQRLADGSEQKV